MKNLKASAIIGGKGDSDRQHLDFYPTPKNATHALMKFLHKECSFYFDEPLRIWEPACGDGDMSVVIQEYGHYVISSDIRETHFGGHVIDYLNSDVNFKQDAIITNPPFNVSVAFIEKAIKEARIVAMLLKSQYWHAKDRIPLFEKTKPQYVLPLTWRPDFLAHTRKPGDKVIGSTMDVCWNVWIKGSQFETRYNILKRP